MSEELKAKIKWSWEEAFNHGVLDVLDEVVAENYLRHKPPFPDIVGLADYKTLITDIRRKYPSCQLIRDKIIMEGNMGAVRWTFEGRRADPWADSSASSFQTAVKFSGCNIFHLEGGKVVEEWEYGDYLGLFQQLGIISKSW
jgi:predicted ester cyclase